MFLRFTPVLATLAVASLAMGCGSSNNPGFQPAATAPAGSISPATPTATIAPAINLAPPTEFAVVVAFDTTSSAIRYATDAKTLVADALPSLLRPGHGGAEFIINTISSNSFDPDSTKLAFHLPGLAPKPLKRAALPRPAEPDLSACHNPFNRTVCEADLNADYSAKLKASEDDEAAAEREWQAALSSWTSEAADRATQVEAIAENLRALSFTLDERGTDIQGALLRAAESLAASDAPRKLVLIASDWVEFGPAQEGDLHFPAGTIVKAFFYDCVESRDCFSRKQSWTEKLLAAGAERVIWLDPAASRLQANPFLEVSR